MFELPTALEKSAILPWEDRAEKNTGASQKITVSIVMPIFNVARHIERTIRSLLCNDLGGVEILIMDGGSSDGTMEIVNYYRDYFTKIHSAPDEGQSDAINQGFAQATGKIFYWLNGDDILLPGALTTIRQNFQQNPDCNVLVGDAYMTEMDLTPINHFQFSNEKLRFDYLLDYASHHLIQPSVFFSKEAWENCGPVRLDYHYAMDADLFLAMASHYKFRYLKMDLAYSVYHEDCKTRDARAESITELALVQASHGGFEQARKTLNILVEMFNQKNTTETGVKEPLCVQCEVLEKRLRELTAQVEQSKAAFLEIDAMDTL